ncbi:hypothetical protein LSH36_623g01083 [Paralvinella palmiformis]|uniref:VWFA domain-containing protein n=1 Tax=Paralvinella palmiformis TaxID=53620 RepID=A0AAD9MX44_9ANNE|nr:hypothetical protein LSH36_623g01083 [Paralvinella palmiformis]
MEYEQNPVKARKSLLRFSLCFVLIKKPRSPMGRGVWAEVYVYQLIVSPLSRRDNTRKLFKMQSSEFLDLAFAMDCTGSMGSYIRNATQNIRKIVEDIISAEKADVRLALVEFRDHPPQDQSFVTRVHDFTSSVSQMRKWLDGCSANGGGDTPEAIADALLQVYKLDWKLNATKVCIFIADAPPHGLLCNGDGFPNGCPAGIEPMEVTAKIAEKGISLYVVGCEPSILKYRDFFMGLAHLTGGKYIPLENANLLSKIIVGGVQEEISLQQLMDEVNLEVTEEFNATSGDIPEEEIVTKVQERLQSKCAKTKRLQRNNAELPESTDSAKQISSCVNLTEVRQIQEKLAPPPRFCKVNEMFLGGPASATADDVYDCVEEEVNRDQVERLVQKSVMMNNLNMRVKKK